MIALEEIKRNAGKQPLFISRYYPGIHMEELRRTTKISIKVIGVPATSRIKSEALLLVSNFWVTNYVMQHMRASSFVVNPR
jgi:hypothetical protein